MAKSEVIDIDKGYTKFLGNVDAVDGAFTKVGVQADAGTVEDEDFSLAELAAVLQFGTEDEHISPRPYQEQAFEIYQDEIQAMQNRLLAGVFSGKLTTKQALDILGQAHTKHIQKQMGDLKEPENAKSTEKKKGFNNPLIETGRLRQSQRHVTVVK